METNEVYGHVVALVEPFAKNKEAFAKISADSRFFQDLEVSSSRLVDVILDIESKFDIQIEDSEADSVNSIGDAVKLIQTKLSKA